MRVVLSLISASSRPPGNVVDQSLIDRCLIAPSGMVPVEVPVLVVGVMVLFVVVLATVVLLFVVVLATPPGVKLIGRFKPVWATAAARSRVLFRAACNTT